MTQRDETSQETLERAARLPCPTCEGTKVYQFLIGSPLDENWDERPCSDCLDASGSSSGRWLPSLGRECLFHDDITCTPAIKPNSRGHIYSGTRCQGTRIIPDLSREACDAAAEKLGFPTLEGWRIRSGVKYGYGYSSPEANIDGTGPTREAAAQAALAAAILATEAEHEQT